MALVVENGSGLANAESYVSVADADAYHAARANPAAWTGATEAQKEASLRIATEYLDGTYAGMWDGLAVSSTQALAWPRTSAYTVEQVLLPYTSVPTPIIRATAELAVRYLASDDGLEPDDDSDADVKRERAKVGSIETEIEYVGGKGTAKRFPAIDTILASLMVYGNANVTFVQRG